MAALKGPTDAQIKKWCKEPDPSTKNFIFQHTMFRVTDIEKSLDFYTRILGMRLLAKFDFEDRKFSLYIVGYEEPENIPSETDKNSVFKRQACIELTYNWDSKDDFKYESKPGEEFIHICICVPDVYAACKRLEELGIKFSKTPDGGPAKGYAFIEDPDGYKIELLKDVASVHSWKARTHPTSVTPVTSGRV